MAWCAVDTVEMDSRYTLEVRITGILLMDSMCGIQSEEESGMNPRFLS